MAHGRVTLRFLMVKAASLIFCLFNACLVHAQVARVEVHPFSSTTLTDEEFLKGQKEGKPVVIAGELRIPKPGADKLPAVILAHGSGGVSGYVDDWAHLLNGMGVATFTFDSFSARGIVTTNNDQSQLSWLSMVVDAYRALGLLAKHPRIDPQRIALMGFSSGGHVALYASLKRFQQMHGPEGASFAAYIPFYPVCSTTYIDDSNTADKPIRIFHGSADDYVPVEPCRTYAERLRKAGKDVRLTEYPEAQHVFDWAALKSPMALPQAQTLRHCRLEEHAGGQIFSSDTQQKFTWASPCVERGVTIGYNAHAAAEAQNAVREIVTAVLLGQK